MNIDTSTLSDRALIALIAGLARLHQTEKVEKRNAYFPDGQQTDEETDQVWELRADLREELINRASGADRFCSEHLLPLIAPDYCDNCPGAHIEDAFAPYKGHDGVLTQDNA